MLIPRKYVSNVNFCSDVSGTQLQSAQLALLFIKRNNRKTVLNIKSSNSILATFSTCKFLQHLQCSIAIPCFQRELINETKSLVLIESFSMYQLVKYCSSSHPLSTLFH